MSPNSKLRLMVMPGKKISQDALGEVEFWRSELRRVRKMLHERGTVLYTLMRAGAEVEPGPLSIELEKRNMPYGGAEVLLINGHEVEISD